jgi:hypothetical protein
MKKTYKKKKYSAIPQYGFGGFLKKMAPTVTGLASSAIPGVGPVIAPAVSGATSALLAEEQEVQPVPTTTGSGSLGNYKYGGKVAHMGTGHLEYHGPKHEQGGIAVDAEGNPTSKANSVAEVEGGETKADDYIFSDSLKVPGTSKTFAKTHKEYIKKGASPEAIEKLKLLQENVQLKENKQGGDELKNGGNIPKYNNGGSTLAGKPDYLNMAANVLPSALQAGMSQRKQNIQDSPKVKVAKPTVDTSSFKNAKRGVKEAYAGILADPSASVNQKLASQTALARQQSDIASKEATYKAGEANRYRAEKLQADSINQRAFQTDRELRAQEQGASNTMLMEALNRPVQNMAKDRFNKRTQIANIVTSANQISNPGERKDAIVRGLRLMGLSEEEIQKHIN